MADYWELFYRTGAPAWYLLHAAQNRAQSAQNCAQSEQNAQEEDKEPWSKPENK